MKLVTICFSHTATLIEPTWSRVPHACGVTRSVGIWSAQPSRALHHLKGKCNPMLLLKLTWSAYIYHILRARNELQHGQNLASEEQLWAAIKNVVRYWLLGIKNLSRKGSCLIVVWTLIDLYCKGSVWDGSGWTDGLVNVLAELCTLMPNFNTEHDRFCIKKKKQP